jgi:hypothetical protein
LEKQIEELKAKVAELEAALEEKAEATTAALEEEGSEAECHVFRCLRTSTDLGRRVLKSRESRRARVFSYGLLCLTVVC